MCERAHQSLWRAPAWAPRRTDVIPTSYRCDTDAPFSRLFPCFEQLTVTRKARNAQRTRGVARTVLERLEGARADGWMAAGFRPRGKSGLHGATVPGNARPGKPEGKRHREQTALRFACEPLRVRVKRWGKSPPRDGQPDRHGKPHREQCQIGMPHGVLRPGVRVGS